MKHVDFDSLAFSKRLQKVGLEEKVADEFSALQFECIQKQNSTLFEHLATKNDLEKLRLEIQSDMKSLIIKFGAMMVASTAITIAALSLILHA